MSLASEKERRGAAVSDLSFFPRVQKEERQDYRQQNNLPESKHTAIELAGLVMSVHVNDERSERDAGDQPDDLTFRIPHANFIGSPTPTAELLPRLASDIVAAGEVFLVLLTNNDGHSW